MVTALTGALLAGSFAAMAGWYHDDACTIAAWQCEIASLSLFAMFFLVPLVALFAVITFLAWVYARPARRRR